MQELAYQLQPQRQAVVDPARARCEACHRPLDACDCGGHGYDGPPDGWSPPPSYPAKWLASVADAYLALFDHDLLPRYIERGGWDHRNHRPVAPGWLTRERRTARWHQSERGRWPILRALAGQLEVGVCFGRLCRAYCVDVDEHRDGPAAERLEAVRAALGLDERTGQFAHRTPGGGYHLWVYLDRPARSADVRSAVLALLAAGGVEVRPGWVEVYPDGGRGVRLPCGKGSDWCVPGVDLDTGEVDRLRYPTRRGVNRRVQLEAYLSEVEACRVPPPVVNSGSISAGKSTDRGLTISHTSKLCKQGLRVGGGLGRLPAPPGLRAVLERGVSAPGRSWEEVGLVVLHEVRGGGAAEQVRDRVLAWWDRTRGGASAGAARSWERKRRQVARDALRYARVLVRDRRAVRRELARGERRALAAACRGIGDPALRASTLLAAGEVLRAQRGQFVRVHWSRWAAWWLGKYRMRNYQRLRDSAARVLGMARVGGWARGRYSQGWAVAWRAGAGVRRDALGRAVVLEEGGRVLAVAAAGGGRDLALWDRGPPWARGDVWARAADFEGWGV